MNSQNPGLFDPFAIKNLTMRNRIGMPPMCMWSAEDGYANDWHVTHYGARAEGGAGLIIVEATAVEPEGRISPADLGLWDDSQIGGMERIVEAIHAGGAAAVLQIAHAGRKASIVSPLKGSGYLTPDKGGWQPFAPSAVAFDATSPIPRELDHDGIHRIQNAFVAAAGRAQLAGFDALEVHSAHGYLSSSFLSPLANHREDQYGGTLVGRSRFLLETVDAVRGAWPSEKPVLVRISCTDWRPDGWTIEDSVWLARELKGHGVDLLDCSSGGNHPSPPTASPGFQTPFAERIRRETGLATAAVGLITGFEQAETIIRTGQADMVLLGRELLRNPYWPIHAAVRLSAQLPVPNQYKSAFR
jgi:2,4-dienoyl-CoA reductase-like NADH-dependent reductase (Old Yellow Enzyme family)